MVNKSDYPILRALIAQTSVEEYANHLGEKRNPSYNSDDAEKIKARADCIARAYFDACGAVDSYMEENMDLLKGLYLLDGSFEL